MKWLIAAAVTAFMLFAPHLRQDESFHLFAGARAIAGIPNFWNVVSNLPFAIVGVLGLIRFRSLTDRVLFAGILLTAFGSAYYHLAPDDNRLLWDRLPMTVIFMAFTAAAIDAGPALLWALVGTGAASVLWWSATNDLRPYAVVKFAPVLWLIPRKDLWPVLGLFGFAQALELADRVVYSGFPLSGHTLKHLVAAVATWEIYRWRAAKKLSTGASKPGNTGLISISPAAKS